MDTTPAAPGAPLTALALGPLAALYEDPTVSSIMVDAPNRVYVERIVDRVTRLEEVPAPFASQDDVRAVIDAVLAAAGRPPAPGQLVAEARLADDSRFLAVLPPAAVAGPCFVLRSTRPWRDHPIEWDDLLRFGSVTQEALDLLRGAVQAQINLLIAGGTASGKTTLANRIAELIPADRRLVVIEAAVELYIRHPRTVRLTAEGASGVSYAGLLHTASCLRPDWLIIGELTGPEALAAMQILGHGHTGLTTIHATSAENALARIESYCLMANLGLGLGDIRSIIASALRLIVFHELMPTGRRRITHVVELVGLEHDRYVLRPLMRYDAETDRLVGTGARPGWEE